MSAMVRWAYCALSQITGILQGENCLMRKQDLRCLSAVLLSGAMLLATGCKQKTVTLETTDPAGQIEEQSVSVGDIVNFTAPQKGEEIVVMTIKDYGDVKIRLFPEESPKGVENFKKLVESGFYDELIFHRVVDGFVIQGGDPKGNGTGGVDAWGSSTGFEQTISGHLCHVTGAVAYAIGPDKLNKSQFYIVTGQECTPDYLQQLRDAAGIVLSPELSQLYQNAGGQPFLDGGYEVFGQVFDGLEHCLAIQKVAVDGNSKPKSPVVIEKAIVTEYDGAEPHWLNAAGGEISVSPN